MTLRIGFLVSHPIQYYTPIFRELAKRCDLTVYFAHRQTAEGQAAAGFGTAFEWDIDLLSGYRSQFLTNVARRKSTDTFRGCDTPEIADEIATGGFDAFVVPGWALLSYWQAVWACRRAGVPVLCRGDSHLKGRRSALLRFAKAAIFPSLLRRFDGFLYVGQWNREYLRHYGVPANRLFFSPHCVDNDAFRAGSEAERERAGGEEAGRPGGRRLLFVGKLMEIKHPLDLVHAAANLRGKGMSIEAAFAGSGSLAEQLEHAARAAGVPAHFHGFVNQSKMPAVYASAEVVVLPSQAESWGLTVNEAMACGVPAIVSDRVGCGPDLIVPGATGATFPCGDVPALASAIEAVLGFEVQACRQSLADRMEVYSPARSAEGIIQGANSLRGRLLVE